MSDNDLIEGFGATDDYHGGKRTVVVADGVLTVSFRRDATDNYSDASETRHYRLVEVVQQWVEVTS